MTSVRDPKTPSIFRDGLFEGKVAIVTGGGTGIGKCIAHELASLGCSVVIAARNGSRLEEAAQEIRARLPKGKCVGEVFCVPCDIRQDDQVDNLVHQSLDHFHKIDFLVNNAGGQYMSLAENISPKGFEAVVRTNLLGTFKVIKKCYEKHMKQHGGSIVNIILPIKNGMPSMCHSGAARAGVENLSKSLSLEWAANGIRVNCIAPGIILSSGVYNYPGGSAEMFERIAKQVSCAKRVGTIEEIAAATLFYLSPASGYITGTTLDVDGGWHLVGSVVKVPNHNKNPPFGTSKL